MKKIIILITAIIFALTLSACSTKETEKDNNINKNLTCTINEVGQDNLSVDYSIKYSFKGNTISRIESISIIEVNPKVLEATINGTKDIIKNMALYDGFTYNITKEDNSHIKGKIEIDYSKINVEDLRTKYGDDYVESDMYLKYSEMTFDSIKESMVAAKYNCK